MLPSDLQSAGSRSPVTYAKLLVVEGRDSFEFFKALLRHLNLLGEMEIRNCGGREELPAYLAALVATSGFDKVTALGLVQDAERDADAAFRSVCHALSGVGLCAPETPRDVAVGVPRVSVFILPDCCRPGMLETLCLEVVSGDPAMSCVEEYVRCVGERLGVAPNPAKSRLQAFLASRQRPGLLLGQAAHRGYFPWESSALDELKEFLVSL